MAPCVLGEHSITEIHAPAYSSFCERLTSFCIMNVRLIHVVAEVRISLLPKKR